VAVCGFDVFIALCDVHFRRKILFFDVVNILDDCPDCYVGVQWFLQLSLYYKVCSCLVTTGRSVPVSFSPSRNNLGTATAVRTETKKGIHSSDMSALNPKPSLSCLRKIGNRSGQGQDAAWKEGHKEGALNCQ
jgi:hypothetical protein